MGKQVSLMDGFRITKLINRLANDLTAELIRLDAKYERVRRSVLEHDVRERLDVIFRKEFPTVYRSYREELFLSSNQAQPTAEDTTQKEVNYEQDGNAARLSAGTRAHE